MKLTDSQLKKIVELRNSGNTLHEIAAKIGVSYTTIWKILVKKGLAGHNNKLTEEQMDTVCSMRLSGMTVRDIAENTGISQPKLSYLFAKEGLGKGASTKRKPNLSDVVKSMRTEGKTFQEIGEELSLSRQRIHQIYNAIVEDVASNTSDTLEYNKKFYKALQAKIQDIIIDDENLEYIGNREIRCIDAVLKDLE